MPEFMDIEQYHALQASGETRSKYGNKRVKTDGYTFDSKAEYRRYLELKVLQRAGEISRLEVHPAFIVMDAYTVPRTGELVKARKYVADFGYQDLERMHHVVEDIKGKRTALFNLKWDLVRVRYPKIRFVLVDA